VRQAVLARPRHALAQIGSSLADLIWPPRSLLSDARVAKSGTMEPELWRALDFLYGSACMRCGMPLPEANIPESECPACLARKPSFRYMRGALAYDDLSRPLILGLKHGGRKDGVGVYANWMIEAAPFAREADVIVPIPLHWTRLFSRGYNQAAWLARAIATKLEKPYAPLTLLRKRATPSQNGLSFVGRARNVEGAFRTGADVAGKHILLVDDVYTTGATFNACTKALLRAGASVVDGVAMARVVRPTQIEVPDAFEGTGPKLLSDAHA
jgi:ComF family protein